MFRDTSSHRRSTSDRSQLRQRLKGFQIYFIILSVVIGSGVFNYNGTVLEVAGPLGLLLAVILNGFIAAFVGETVSELVQLFPAQNAIYLYVEQFVDEDLAWVASLTHWYCWASILPLQMLNAARMLEYWWQGDKVYGPILYYGFTPCVLFVINLVGVNLFGWIETFGGALKMIIVFAVSCALYNVSRIKNEAPPLGSINSTLLGDTDPFCVHYSAFQKDNQFPKNPIYDAFQANEHIFPADPFLSFCFVMPWVSFIFLGVETIAIAAYEAETTKSIARSSQITHWSCLILCSIVTFGITLSVKWNDCRLPEIWNFITRGPILEPPYSDSATIISLWDVDSSLAGVANGALIFCVLSCANTSLYVSSRTLYGATYQLRNNHGFSRYLKRTFGQVWPTTGVPAMALLFSLVTFYWLPFFQYKWKDDPHAVDEMIQIVSLTSSVSCVITWTLLIIAYLRYHYWTTSCAEGLEQADMQRFVRSNPAYKAWNVLIWFQPWTARIALVGCLFIYACLSATWWRKEADPAKVMVAYGPHIVSFAFWIFLKLCKHGVDFSKWWVSTHISTRRPTALIQKLRHLERLSAKGEERERQQDLTLFYIPSPTPMTEQIHTMEQGNGHAITTNDSALGRNWGDRRGS